MLQSVEERPGDPDSAEANMVRWKQRWSMATLVVGLAAGWSGCSDDDEVVGLVSGSADGGSEDGLATADGADPDALAADSGAGTDGAAADGDPGDVGPSDGAQPGDGAPIGDGAASDAPTEELPEDADAALDPDGDGSAPADGAIPTCPGQPGCACASDGDCPADSACLAWPSGKLCAQPCLSEVKCPADTQCTVLPAGDPTDPKDDKPVCAPKGPQPCDPSQPAPELCDGKDNDCNGATDDKALCEDGSPCTADSCQEGACVYLPASATCSDANACTDQDTCGGGKCKGTAVLCDDKNPCTTDSCDQKSGCQFAANTAACDDGNACTGNDACAAGSCTGQPGACPCAADADCKDKNDSNLCNGVLYCDKTIATPSCKINPASVVVCDPKDDGFCAVAKCDTATGSCGLSPQNQGKPCNDGTACTLQDSCTAGKCSGAPLLCDDANACTNDACDSTAGCTHKANAAPCSDGDACTLGDVCTAGACKVTPKTCDDGYACSADTCDKASGACAFTLPLDATCGVQMAPYVDAFPCDATATAAQWNRSGGDLAASAVRWAFDASPALPQASGTGCSLNVNNGKDLACGPGQNTLDLTADSPWIDVSAIPSGKPLVVRFASTGSWTAQHSANVWSRGPGGAWTLQGTVTAVAANSWAVVAVPLKAVSGGKVQVRLRLAGPCAAGQIGWFVDDFSVSADPCAASPAPCKANETCAIAANATAACTACKPGFQVAANQCVDIDECATAGSCAAAASCTNSAGSFSCACQAGYSGDGKTCTDIDECATAKDDCDKSAVCVNKPGTFQCACAKELIGDGKACYKKGSNAKAPAASCLEILTLYPGSADGSYWLDLDGAGASPSTSYYCDMKSGGWTLLIFDDFEDGTTKGWSAGKVQGCGKYGKMLGGVDVFGKGAAPTKTVAAPIHTQAKLALKYVRIDSWDNESAVVQLNGNAVFSKKGQAGLIGNECGKWNWDEDHWDVAWSGEHTAAQAVVTVTSTLDQGADDEAFAFDNAVLWVK